MCCFASNICRSHSTDSDSVYHSVTSSPEKETTYLVFESALLLLFQVCSVCACARTSIKKYVSGSFLRIIQSCSRCGKVLVWESQPYIGNIPAGNLLTSAAILFAGAFPAKSLRIFSTLNCATISLTTFFRHQSACLFPAVRQVYEQHQNSLLAELKEKGDLTVAGDGRADSPGHSAKYGSYSLIDLTCNKVVDFKLVQVIP